MEGSDIAGFSMNEWRVEALAKPHDTSSPRACGGRVRKLYLATRAPGLACLSEPLIEVHLKNWSHCNPVGLRQKAEGNNRGSASCYLDFTWLGCSGHIRCHDQLWTRLSRSLTVRLIPIESVGSLQIALRVVGRGPIRRKHARPGVK